MDTPRSLPRNELIPWKNLNSRTRFELEGMKGLKASLKEVGMGQPIAIKLQPKPPHWIIAGERRWKAAKGILTELPVHVLDITFAQAIAMNLTENIQSQSLTAMEEARGIVKLMDTTGETQTDVAATLGKTQGWVSNRIRLLRLSKPLQDLFDEEAFTQSQARDLILPFASLPDQEWDAFCKGLCKALTRRFKKVDRTLTEEEIREPASKVAMAMSGWLDHHFWQGDQNDIFTSQTRIPKKRWKNAPKGTIVTYLYGDYPHNRSTRAFDMDWWQEQMHVTKVEDAAEAERRKKEIEEGDGEIGEGGKDLEWTPALGPIPLGTEIPHWKRHVVYRPINPNPGEYDYTAQDCLAAKDGAVRRVGNLNADPTVIPEDNLVVQLGAGLNDYNQPTVLCTDHAIYEAAIESLMAKKETMVKRRIARQAKDDIERSKGIKLAQAVPSLLAVGWALDRGNFITEAAEELEIAPTWNEYSKNLEDIKTPDLYAWAVQLQNYLASLKKTQLDAIAKLLVYRLTRSETGQELNMREKVRQSVAFELRVKLLKELGERVDLPEWSKGGKDAEEK